MNKGIFREYVLNFCQVVKLLHTESKKGKHWLYFLVGNRVKIISFHFHRLKFAGNHLLVIHIFSFFVPLILSSTRCSNIFSHSPNKSPGFCLQVTSHLGNLVERERAMTKLVNNGPEEHLDLVEKMQKGLKVRRSL